MNWLLSANSSVYLHREAFEKFGFIDWVQTVNFNVDDTVYIYLTSPDQRVGYKCIVEKNKMNYDEIVDDSAFWVNGLDIEKAKTRNYVRLKLLLEIDEESLSLAKLMENGLKGAPQRTTRLIDTRENVLIYIEKVIESLSIYTTNPDEVKEPHAYYEGALQSTIVNRFERNSAARKKCITFHGTCCKVCDLDFGKHYGEFAAGFIHVHHLVPLAEINQEYKVNYKTDLITVCPNCHAMLHYPNEDGLLFSIRELQEQINRQK